MLSLKVVGQFKKDMKKYRHKQAVVDDLDRVVRLLLQKTKLPEKYRDHALSGQYIGMRECHIKPDVLLVYSVDLEARVLYLERLGSHSELF